MSGTYLINTCLSTNSSNHESVLSVLSLIALILYCSYRIHISHQTFMQLGTSASISPSCALLVAPISPQLNQPPVEISVVYYCAGYSLVNYVSPADYATHVLLECSHTVQCPSFPLQLVGWNKVQEVLTHLGMLERFLAPFEGTNTVHNSWVRMWALEEGADEAVRCVHKVVLKLQHKGGGNNIYHNVIPLFIMQLPICECTVWITMELVHPPHGIGVHLVRSGRGSACIW